MMRLGPVHVVVITASAALRTAIVDWLKTNKRVRIVKAAGSVSELGPQPIECDLVVSSALDGPRHLRVIGKRFADTAGLVALSLGTTQLPAGWIPVGPGGSQRWVLDHARAHPERTVARQWAGISAAIAAIAAIVAAPRYVPVDGVSFQRAALAYAQRFPDASTWWHVWGAGAPLLAADSWPLLKLGALIGSGPEVFVLLAAGVGALCAASFLTLALHSRRRFLALGVGVIAALMPAAWVWPRGGDISSAVGLSGVLLTLAATGERRFRFAKVAVGVAVSAGGGLTWAVAAAAIAIAVGVRSKHGRESLGGGLTGVALSAAISIPPFLSRGIDAVRPPLARAMAVSDVAPVIAIAALFLVVAARGRARAALMAAGIAVAVAANGLALAVPTPTFDVPNVPTTGSFGRLAVHPTEALAYAGKRPDLGTTGGDVSSSLMLGGQPKDATNAELEWAGADRALLPDVSSGEIFNEREWKVLDRQKLLFAAPRVRPILTAGITPNVLVVADPQDAKTFGDALIHLGTTSDRVIPVFADRPLDQIDQTELRSFTVLVIYGQPWKDHAKAEKLLNDFLQISGFVLWDAAARPGSLPVVGEARATSAATDLRSIGKDGSLVTDTTGYAGDAVSIGAFQYANDQAWEQAALVSGDRRLMQFGSVNVAGSGDTFAHMVWSGLDLPKRVVAEDPHAMLLLGSALQWLVGSAVSASGVQQTGQFAPPIAGDTLDEDTATSTFLGPTHWRIELKTQSTGVLFKEHSDPRWSAFQVDQMRLSDQQARSRLPIWKTTHGYMYVVLPPNARIIDFVFEAHPLETAARGVSAIALFLVLGVTFFQWRRR